MGLIKAAVGAAGGVLADQWKEYFYCEAMPADVLVTKAHKKVSGRSSNKHGSENIISNGSVIAVNDGQCMLIVEQGKVVDVCAEPGEYTYDMSTEPSLFCGDLGEGIKSVFQQIGKRFTFGGEAPKDQRVYFVNTKELVGNKYGTPNPVPFRVVDNNIGLDIDISIKCFGEYSYRIANPILFYTNVCGNVEQDYEREEIDGQLKSELMTASRSAVILSASLSLDGQYALKGGGGDPEPLGNGDVIFHGLGDGMTAHHQHMRTAEQVAPHVDAALMLLGNGVIEEKRLIERRTNRRKARLIDSAAILRRQLCVFVVAAAPCSGDICEGSFH